MLVTFTSSETGSFMIFADTVRPLLKAIGKVCTARGVITRPEMLPAVAALERYLQDCAATSKNALEAEAEDKELPAISRPVSPTSRAWPLIDMLTRSAQSKKESHVIWEAAGDFDS
ncbi:MAG: DUF1840 domain-containing protein [Zoogloeaceae bacterium]|jgi:hypothetical protein|nr:DUF1840 domain-containing protein [Zoogloeaceae bacterium]